MLQKYDKLKSSLLLAVAAAGGAALSLPANAGEASCTPENGYAAELTAYVAEVAACISAAENFEANIADGLLAELNSERQRAGLEPLKRRASLDMAAQAHALDMSARIYADHLDPEGRDHLHRIRAFDRTMLVGASGSNVVVSRASEDAATIHNLINRDAFNHANLMRDSFTDVGIGVVEEAGQYYVVQVFAAAEGDLDRAIPISATGTYPLKASLLGKDRQVVAWGLVDHNSGELLARSKMPRVRYSNIRGTETANLDVLVAARDQTYVLKGPLVSGRD